MRHEVTDEVAAAFRDDGEPALGIFLEHPPLERIELVADEDRDCHVEPPDLRSLRGPAQSAARRKAPRSDPVPGAGGTTGRFGILALDRHQCFGYRRSMKAGPDIAMVASLV